MFNIYIKFNDKIWRDTLRKGGVGLIIKKVRKIPMKHFNIAEFNSGQSSKIIRSLVADDDVTYINKNGKPMAIVLSNERYERLLANGIYIKEY